jgi:hypothetical protein
MVPDVLQLLTSRFRLRLFLVSCITAITLAPGVVHAGSDKESSYDSLLQRYAPAMASPSQTSECGVGEALTPIAIDDLLGRDDIVLRDASGAVITQAPTAKDLFSAPSDSHLDIPGNALDPKCDYEKWFRSLNAEPTIYGRIAADPRGTSRLAVQYWFFWPYNDWNNRHEGDWEMMQINFATSSISEALTQSPVSVILAQHEGGEIQQWKNVSQLNGKPLIFPASGSHATYFSANRWVGTSAQTGVGCDDTRTPSRVLTPRIISLPYAAPTSPDDDFAWLAFAGHWGEQHAGFNNGPKGPTSKQQWFSPLEWSDTEGRAGSIALPPLGTQATDFFCGASERFSALLLNAIDQPWKISIALLVLIFLVVSAIRRTSWTPADPFPITARRRTGMLWTSSVRYIGKRKWKVLPFIAFLFIGGAFAQWLRQIVFRATSTGDLSDPLDPNINAVGGLSYGVWLLVLIPVVAITIAGITRLMQAENETNHSMTFRRVLRETVALQRLLPSLVFTVFMFVVALFQVIVFWFTPRWILAPAFAPDRRPFKKAAEITQGHRRHIVAIAFITLTAVTVLGPLVGAILLLATTYSLTTLSMISSAINAVLVVWGVVTLNYLHADLTHQRDSELSALN